MIDFHIHNRNHEIYTAIVNHLDNSRSILENRIKAFHQLNENEQQHELDLYHSILKHGRACDASECAAQSNFEAIQHLIINQILPPLKTLNSYPLLVCMIDLIKNSPTTLDTDTLHLFLSLVCNLWQHEKIYMCRKSMELCKRIIPLLKDDNNTLFPCIIQYIHDCRTCMTRDDIDRIQSPEYTEFFYTPVNQKMTYDRECIKMLIQIILSVSLNKSIHQKEHIHALITEINDLCSNQDAHEIKTILFDICCTNDDGTIQLLDTILTIYQQQQQQQQQPTFISFLQTIDINPHTLFLFFLSRCGNTHDIIIDLLLENDSDFLSYFHRYIMYANQNIQCFKSSLCQDPEAFLRIVANTILVLEGDGFPYNTKPLIRRLIQLEDQLYANADV